MSASAGNGTDAGRAGQGVTILADGFSCRTQLDHLADIKATHLAELLASRLPEDNSKEPKA
jgi:hypothetical protein